MHRILIVANRTLGGAELRARVERAARAGPCRVHVLVPSSRDDAAAHERLAAQLAQLREMDVEAHGRVVVGDPFEAVRAELRREDVDEVVVCTLPPGLSTWLGLDLVRRIRRHTDLPVAHVVAPAGLPERLAYDAVRVTVFVSERDRDPGGRGALYAEIVRRAQRLGLAGATVLRGVEGFGASSVIHTTRLVGMSEDLPVVVILIDTPDRVEALLPELDDLLTEGLVVQERVHVVKYAGRRDA